MKVAFIKDAAKGLALKAKPAIFVIRKHAPEILVGTGVVSVMGGTALACKATLDAKDILEEELYYENEVEVEDAPENMSYVETGYRGLSELNRKEAVTAGLKVLKAYAPSVGLIGGGIAMLVAAKSIEHRRFTAALGAYSSLQAMFEEYRERVIEEAGPALDQKCLTGKRLEKVSYPSTDPETGKTKKVKEEVTVYTGGEDPYHRIFDPFNCPGTWQDNLEDNKFFLECQQKYLNMELSLNGRVFLNDVLKRLGFDYCEVGQFVGWLADDIEGSKDGFIDFGIDYVYLEDEIAKAQLEGRRPEPSIWLNFNCDGEVWDNPLKKKRECV